MDILQERIKAWEDKLSGYSLPKWEDIPDFGLYMEQVIVLMKQYFDVFPNSPDGEQLITAAAINNYVRTKVLPKPEKKKYYRLHIAYIIMICVLKQSVSISFFQKLIPIDVGEDRVRETYNAYSRQFMETAEYFTKQIGDITAPLSDEETDREKARNEAIVSAAILSSLSKVFAEQLSRIDIKDGEICSEN